MDKDNNIEKIGLMIEKKNCYGLMMRKKKLLMFFYYLLIIIFNYRKLNKLKIN